MRPAKDRQLASAHSREGGSCDRSCNEREAGRRRPVGSSSIAVRISKDVLNMPQVSSTFDLPKQETDRYLVVSADTHCGPSLHTMRQYCPAAHLDVYDAFTKEAEE